jgi:colanic acid biosynthesis glycosyl transferase WcaI
MLSYDYGRIKTAMKFVMITQYYAPEVGDRQTRLAATTKALISLGHQAEVVTAMPNDPMGEIASAYLWKFYVKEEREGALVHRFWLFVDKGKAINRLLTHLSFMLTSLVGISKIRTPEVIFVNAEPVFLGIVGAVYSWIFQKPMVLYLPEIWPKRIENLENLNVGDRILYELSLSLESWVYRQSRIIAVSSDEVKESLLKVKVKPEKLFVVSNNDDENAWRSLSEKLT